MGCCVSDYPQEGDDNCSDLSCSSRYYQAEIQALDYEYSYGVLPDRVQAYNG